MANPSHHFLLYLYFLGVPRPLGLPFELSLIQGQGFSTSGWLGFTLLLSTGISASGVLGDWLALSTAEPIFFFSVSVPSGYFHHPSQRHISRPTKFQDQLSILNAFLEGTNCLMLGHIFHCVMQSGPPLNVISQSLIRFLHAMLQFC